MIAKTGIKGSHFKIAVVTKVVCFLRNFLFLKSSMGNECRPHSHHNFTLFSFYDQMRINFWQEGVKCLSSNLGMVAVSFFFRDLKRSCLLDVSSMGLFVNPIYQRLISIGNFYIGMVIQKVVSCFGSKKTNKKTPFPINYSCKICNFCISHKTPLFKTIQYTINPDICTA